MNNLIVFDTSVLIDHLRTGRHAEKMAGVTGLIRNSAVVLSELWRGVTKPAERVFLKELQKNHAILTPTEKNWMDSGEILGRIRKEKGFSGAKIRDLHFDILIALTARSTGARLITANHSDFQMIQSYRQFSLELW